MAHSPIGGALGIFLVPQTCKLSPSPVVLQLYGALAPCQAAEDFLQSLLGSMSCHMLSLKHPGSARFLLGPQGQHLLRELEAQFRCVFGTEHLARDTLDMDPGEVAMEPAPALRFLTPQALYLLHPCSEAWHSLLIGGPH